MLQTTLSVNGSHIDAVELSTISLCDIVGYTLQCPSPLNYARLFGKKLARVDLIHAGNVLEHAIIIVEILAFQPNST